MASPGFRRGATEAEKAFSRGGGGLFEAGMLPDSEKERLCRMLLEEFGATHIRPGGDGELVHGCLLPFGNHKDQDRNPTASLNWKKLVYSCLGCGAGGGLIWFIGLCRDESGEQARQWLEEQTGTGADEQSLASLLAFFDAVYDKSRRDTSTPIPRMNDRVLEPWLCIHPYLTEDRGVPEDNVIEAKVGYGVLRIRVGEDRFVDSHRIVIPHFWKGDLVGWQSRRLIKADGTAKYLSTPDFPKDQTVYRYDEKADVAIVVESPMSVLAKLHLGHIEATFGASVTDRQVQLLSMHRKVVLFMDNDEAGWNATRRLGEALEAYSAVWVVENPFAADPADMDDDTYTSLVEEAVPYAVWTRPETLEEWAA